MDDDQLERFGQAVEEKKQEAKEASERTGEQNPAGSAVGDDQENLYRQGPQDVTSARDKNAGKGKKTADKWNQ